ncbi:uncharacterized protein ACJ7VT_002154 [Polymixia lowei]
MTQNTALRELDWNQLDRCIVSGYIHSVPKRNAQRLEFFWAWFQHQDQIWTMYVYQKQLREDFRMAEKNRTPVMLEGVEFRMHEGREVMVYTSNSTFCPLDSPLPFTFDPWHSTTTTTLKQLMDTENSDGRMVKVVVQMLQKVQVGRLQTPSGIYRHRMEWLIADSTGSAHLTVWDPLNVTERKWYCITNILVGGILQTSPCSKLKALENPQPSVALDDAMTPKTIRSKIIGVELREEGVTCPESHLLKRRRGATMHCGRCTIMYKRETMRRILSGRLSVECSRQPLEVQDCHIRALLGDLLVDSKKTVTFLQKELLKIQMLQITVYQGNVLSVVEERG